MNAAPSVANEGLVSELRYALRDLKSGLGSVPRLVKVILRDDAWRERVIETGAVVRFERFVDFVSTPPLEGLGADLATIKDLCGKDPETLGLITQASVGQHGGDRRSSRIKHNNVILDAPEPLGNTREQAIRRLRKDRPDLYERVLAGELSPHGAMVQAGLRRQTVTLPLEPLAIARTLRRRLSAEQLAALVAALTEES